MGYGILRQGGTLIANHTAESDTGYQTFICQGGGLSQASSWEAHPASADTL